MYKLQWYVNRNTKQFIHGNAFGAVTCEMAAVLSRKRCFNIHFPGVSFLDDNTIGVHVVEFTIRKKTYPSCTDQDCFTALRCKYSHPEGYGWHRSVPGQDKTHKNVNHVHPCFCSVFQPPCVKGYDAPDPVLCPGVICFLLFFINVFNLWFVYFGKNCLFFMWIMDWLMCCQVRIQLKTYVGLMIIAVYNTKGLLK